MSQKVPQHPTETWNSELGFRGNWCWQRPLWELKWRGQVGLGSGDLTKVLGWSIVEMTVVCPPRPLRGLLDLKCMRSTLHQGACLCQDMTLTMAGLGQSSSLSTVLCFCLSLASCSLSRNSSWMTYSSTLWSTG